MSVAGLNYEILLNTGCNRVQQTFPLTGSLSDTSARSSSILWNIVLSRELPGSPGSCTTGREGPRFGMTGLGSFTCSSMGRFHFFSRDLGFVIKCFLQCIIDLTFIVTISAAGHEKESKRDI